ncbi:MAG: hypothetical protein HZA49_01480 [Planctomycetes bacterium]|nr:hypothetical protein [Planctomycetota bacterium]
MKKATLWVSGVLITLALTGGCVASHSTPHGQTTLVIMPAVPAPVFAARPVLVLVDGAPEVYFVSGLNVYFHLNAWYYYCQGKWFHSAGHNGPWVYVENQKLPARMGRIPPGHLKTPPGQAKPKDIPPGQAKDSPGHGKDKDKGKDKDSPKHKGKGK